jgi:hypothetical protein
VRREGAAPVTNESFPSKNTDQSMSASPALRFNITTHPQRVVYSRFLRRRTLRDRGARSEMSASTSGVATPADEGAGPGLKKLKILMLHGVYHFCCYYCLHLPYDET